MKASPFSSQTPGPLETLIRQLATLPGLGQRSARRAALHLLQNKDTKMLPLAEALGDAAEKVRSCHLCGNLDMQDPCAVCESPVREPGQLCVVAQVSDLWAIERTGMFKGLYFVLGGVLSALDGVGPADLRIESLIERLKSLAAQEVILALSATVDGQSTAHYIEGLIQADNSLSALKISRLAHGVPVGGELDYLDEGTIATALKRRS